MSWLGWDGGEWLEKEDQLLFSTHEGMGRGGATIPLFIGENI